MLNLLVFFLQTKKNQLNHEQALKSLKTITAH